MLEVRACDVRIFNFLVSRSNILSDAENSSYHPSDYVGSAPSQRFLRFSMPSTVLSGDDRSGGRCWWGQGGTLPCSKCVLYRACW